MFDIFFENICEEPIKDGMYYVGMYETNKETGTLLDEDFKQKKDDEDIS